MSSNPRVVVLAVVQVMHVLELDMPPSGCLAPGASATLKVTFKPLVSWTRGMRYCIGTVAARCISASRSPSHRSSHCLRLSS